LTFLARFDSYLPQEDHIYPLRMNVPVFIDISLEEQAVELRSYFKSLGAEITLEGSEKGIEDDLHKIIGVCDACFKDQPNANPSEIEEVFNGIVSMLALVEKSENLIVAFCEKLSKAPTNGIGTTCLKVMWSLCQSLENASPMRVHVYYYLVQLAGKLNQIDLVYKDMESLRSTFVANPPSNEQMQELFRLLHEVLLSNGRSEDASQVMVELLGTYTTENASQAREEAQRCIVASLADPQTFLLDRLLQLTPVKFLERELIHDLLKIFVSDRLEAYQSFYKNHQEFIVNQLGLNHDANMRKMRILTFMQIAETQSEISFKEIQKSMQIEEGEVEEFLIDLLRTRLVRAKIDQPREMVHVTSAMHRTFDKAHWTQLHSLLTDWKTNLHTVREHIGHLAQMQIKLIHHNKQI